MSNFMKRDYAINKMNKQNIVYRSVTGEITEISASEVGADMKTLSDELYHEIEKSDHVYYNHCISLHASNATSPSHETTMVDAEEADEKKKLARLVFDIAKEHLTDNQRKRFFMYVNGMTMREIALSEGISSNAVFQSIESSRKKIKKVLQKHMDKTPFSRQ